MKFKNISEGNFNLESGVCKPGQTAELTIMEYKLLDAQGRIGPAEVAKKKKAKKND